jgi:beta-ureidopropionase / N-carbamoyl-L-amino-acid hydrolase
MHPMPAPQSCRDIAAADGLEIEVNECWYFPPTPFHPDLVAAMRKTAEAQGYLH